MSHLLGNVTRFVRLLRDAGLPVTLADTRAFVEALELVGLADRTVVKSAGRALLVHRHEHQPLYDRAFDLLWRVIQTGERLPPELGSTLGRSTRRADVVARHELAGAPPPGPLPEIESAVSRQQTWSHHEQLRRKDFADLTEEERREVHAVMEDMQLDLPPRRTRRTAPHRRGPAPDLRATVRRSLRHGGEPIRLLRRTRVHQPRPLVVLCDISGSMASYSRVLLQFVYTVGRVAGTVEAFAFGTRLTRLTRHLRQRSVNDALRDATHAVVDWGGGTRIGDALRAFNWQWSRRVLRRGAIVLVISDGWDRGDPELLRTEMMRLRRSCRRLIWLNPLIAQPGFEPLTAGLRAALPHVDDFLPIHNLLSLEQLADRLAELGRRPGERGRGWQRPTGPDETAFDPTTAQAPGRA